ncbi:GNAT family N-acetyltransferase [Paenibacillus sp. JCM 10914]|uniref:GNAT family N-acetyltransferase n=1 Tax=Paenibacillus sp. JCM 10914 TaxID=1236974 RepID=UPI0003CC7448|nr:GNAT family N-acetyltransferase [Paenibacillus sp. JCM 10914]GAE06818.1 histone acetyltransferase HPA2 and related acetyltransferases [Paenibacillus sp. JCM 10914]
MKIRVLHESDASLYQELRLQGLQTDAYAFGSTYEREASFSMETMMERVKLSKDKFVLGAFEASGKLAGIVTFVREVGTKTAHKGNVFGMYVSSDMRGKGIGRQLMQG